jgi:hypothetical protein
MELGPFTVDIGQTVGVDVQLQLAAVKSAVTVTARVGFVWDMKGDLAQNPFDLAAEYDSTNVSLQANSPPISAYPASRPDPIGNPNNGPHTVEQWLSASAFQRLKPVTQAGQFGNAGRDIARGPAFTDLDASLIRQFAHTEITNLQFRAESNHPNFRLPVADLNSTNFGQILSAGSARLMQFALKLTF